MHPIKWKLWNAAHGAGHYSQGFIKSFTLDQPFGLVRLDKVLVGTASYGIWTTTTFQQFAYCSICLFLLLTFRLKPLHLWGFLRVIATFGSTVHLFSLVSLGKMPVRNPISPKQSINRMPQLPPSMDSLDSHMRGIFLVLYFFSCHT